MASAILLERFLSLDFTWKMTFSGAIALQLGLSIIPCFDVLVGVSVFVARAIDILRFASHTLLRALDWTGHMLQLPNVNVVVPLCFASQRLLRAFHVLRLPH